MTKDEALQAIDRLERLTQDFGFPNAELLASANKDLWSLRHGPVRDSYFLEKLTSVEHWAAVGFSTRKFKQYAGGAEQVGVFALGDLGTARFLVEQQWSE
jgi:hypothetical protein